VKGSGSSDTRRANLGVEVMWAERQYALAHMEEFLYDKNNSSTDSSLAR